MLKASRRILGGRSLSEILRDDFARYGFTHALRIPTSTQASRPQLTKSLQHAMSDPTAANIYPAAFNPPGVHCITLGYLALETPDMVERASQFLNELRLDKILSEIINSKNTVTHPPGISSSDSGVLKPLRVSVSGLTMYGRSPSTGRGCLYAPVVDHTEMLSAFVTAVRAKFISAGFAKLRSYDRSLGMSIALHVKIMGNTKLLVKEKNDKPSTLDRLPPDFVLFKKARFDVRDFCTKFQNMTWASDFALERLCIGGPTKFEMIKDERSIDQGYEEIASVPLPGMRQLKEDPFLKHVEYIKTKKIILENNVADTRGLTTIINEFKKKRTPRFQIRKIVTPSARTSF